MNWDLELEKLRQESFRPTVPPPVRLPRWAAVALMGAGITLGTASCGGREAGAPDPGAQVSTMDVAPAPEVAATEPPAPRPEPAIPPPVEPAPVPPPVEPSPPMDQATAPASEEPAPMIMKAPKSVTDRSVPPVLSRRALDYSLAAPMYGAPEPMYGAPAPMYGGPAVDSRPVTTASGLVPGDAPQDVKRVLQGFPYTIGSCFQFAHRKGLVGDSGDLQVSMSASQGKFTVTALGGSLAGNGMISDCVKARLSGKSAGSSDEAVSYAKTWTFSISIVAPKSSPLDFD